MVNKQGHREAQDGPLHAALPKASQGLLHLIYHSLTKPTSSFHQ